MSSCAISLTVVYCTWSSALSLLSWKMKKRRNQTLCFQWIHSYFGNSSGWPLFLTINTVLLVSPSPFLVTSSWFITILMYHECVPIAQYPQFHAEIVEVRLSQRSIFALAYWKLMEIIAKNSTWVVYSFWEGESEKEQASVKGFLVPARTRVCVCLSPDQRLYRTDSPPKSEDFVKGGQ